MPRPMVLAFLLMILIVTSQFEWKQQLVVDLETNPSISQKQDDIFKKQEVVKEKIILSQERNIQKLNELVRSLQQQLDQCRMYNNALNETGSSLASNVIEVEKPKLMDNSI